ncbi:hypothetical protein NW755_013677 [Fusarium falciforme]|uniref:Uncharacterized protein n=1 Tax=Fusarium falciforme TaxID=195108 RepID=A0A9W8QVJ7_9HYPO|nr:hypothetical protein NW755_013677 [Fusarium falciforme]
MRHDGEWPHFDLDPSRKKDALTIRHKRDQQGNIIEESKITDSCDEFPASSWVEGGTGISIPGLDKCYPEESRSSYDELQVEENDQGLNLTYTPLFSRASTSDLAQARKLVNNALAKPAKLNKRAWTTLSKTSTD